MEIEVASPSSVSLNLREQSKTETEMERGKDPVRVKRKTLQAVLEQCQRALELISDEGVFDDDDKDESKAKAKDVEQDGKQLSRVNSFASPVDRETDELCDLLKSRVERSDFLEKLECAQVSFPQSISELYCWMWNAQQSCLIAEDCNSWDMVSANDVWESEDVYSDQEDYVLVRQEDIVEGIACFMAAYLLSLKQTKDLTPNQLQEALSKTFSVKKKKGKLRKAWDGSKVIYNVASWGATAIGIYQNPVILRVATNAFWTSCNVISKLL